MEEKKIVLVEDNTDHADMITQVFMEGDLETKVVLVQDGMAAIDYFQEIGAKWRGQIEYKIKLVILDLNLPKISGMDILKFLKKNSMYCKIPVVVLSTSSDKKMIDEAYKNGVNGYFVKPASYEEFVDKIKILKKCY